MISLNVGGQVFYTSRATLSRYDCFFSKLWEGHEVFIDRDPTHFRYILNFMRGSTVLPMDVTTLQEIRVEADFYCLHNLVRLIDNKYPHDDLKHLCSVEQQLRRICERISM